MTAAALTIGTRGSQLALWQANHVKQRLQATHPGLVVHLQVIKTTGDKITDVPLAKVGGKGLFVKEIEEAMLRGEIDLAVHSMKDVPTVLPRELHLAVVTEREDARDAVLSRDGRKFLDLPSGAVVGTSSLRRQAQLRSRRPDLAFESLRGNLDTRLRKLQEGRYAAVILAAAGLRRLGLEARVTEYLDATVSLPAIGQGALGLECRVDDARVHALIAALDHRPTHVCVAAERAFLERLEGGCQVPIAAHATLAFDAGRELLRLDGLVASVDGARVIREQLAGLSAAGPEMGRLLAERILSRGGGEILRQVYAGG